MSGYMNENPTKTRVKKKQKNMFIRQRCPHFQLKQKNKKHAKNINQAWAVFHRP